MDDLVGRQLSHYRIIEKLGEGGMGVVYRARDERLDRDVAVKVLAPEVAKDPERLERFEREARAVAALNHPNIVTIHDVGSDDGVMYLVTELLEGEPLRELLDRRELDTRRAVELGRQIARGLTAAHERGIVHRDLKPENLFVTVGDHLKILDFGLARLLPAEMAEPAAAEARTATLATRAGKVLGTVGYMSPEQLRGRPVDERSDVFSFGVVFYELLTGLSPFRRLTAADTNSAILTEEPPPPSQTTGRVLPTFDGIVRRCLVKKPEQRYASGRELLAALEAVLEAPARPQPFRRTRPLYKPLAIIPVVLAAALALAVLLGMYKVLLKEGPQEPAVPEVPRIVVLPFDNLGAAEDEFFADGITEEITSRLASVEGLRVISRTSAIRYKENRPSLEQIGRELEVQYAIEGTVRWDRSQNAAVRVRITPQLIRVADDSHLWAQSYDRVLEDIFQIQSEIAGQVVAQLDVSLGERELKALEARPTANMEAYEAYLKGISHHALEGSESGELAVSLFERAVELDPDFALARAALAGAQARLYHFFDYSTSRRRRIEIAQRQIDRALELEPGLPQAHIARAHCYYYGDRDYQRALAELEIAGSGLPNSAEVHDSRGAILRRQGRWQEAVAAFDRALELDPRNPIVLNNAASTASRMRRYERADELLQRATATAPDRLRLYFRRANSSILWHGSTERAREILDAAPTAGSMLQVERFRIEFLDRGFERALDIVRGAGGTFPDGEAFPWALLECQCLLWNGDRELAASACGEALEILEEQTLAMPEAPALAGELGWTYALLGRKQEAIREGRRAVAMVPLSRDAVRAPELMIRQAAINAQVGEHDVAIDSVEELLSIPCYLSAALLRLDPVWDPIRDHPRFQALLERHE